MKIVFAFIVAAVSFLSVNSIQAQSPAAPPASETRPRAVSSPRSLPDSERAAPAAETSAEAGAATPEAMTGEASSHDRAAQAIRQFSPAVIRTRIAEAERLFKSRPRPTSLSSTVTDVVTLALLDRATGRLHQLSVSKQTFLTKNAEVTMTTSLGTPVTLRVLRANGVNTAVVVLDAREHPLTPLVVEFPIEKGGVFREMAYYTSAHPALLSVELTKSGQTYVRSMIDLAVKRLREKGAFISPHIVDVAERLCLVEHVDHERFRNENRKALFDEIYSLYALNELDTYRYSVSFAGAGGMVQMIPWAYNLERQRHPGVGLMPDFVAGMRNHPNALQAMLLYMQDTWNDLAASEDVKSALEAKIATPTELLAAGYNSNAAKLPLYIRRGGNGWRTLIPRETQMYLQIYKSVDGLIPMKPRTAATATPKAE
jgi:hypothetical protein